ncbi:MAG: gamma-glutamylcyclotransferase [Candidatus Doudnabacteria bacterium]|nr:gamma-glutamylcyclotransferase [Candidatus Doudnabacteria bacterium]
MSLEHMRRVCGWHCQFLGRAHVPGFDVVIDQRGYLNIVKKENSELHGILYRIDEDGLAMMDAFEGFPSVFERQEVLAYDEHKIKYKAQVYYKSMEGGGGQSIRQEYFRRVIAAAYENKLPEEWVAKLEKLLEGKQKI